MGQGSRKVDSEGAAAPFAARARSHWQQERSLTAAGPGARQAYGPGGDRDLGDNLNLQSPEAATQAALDNQANRDRLVHGSN